MMNDSPAQIKLVLQQERSHNSRIYRIVTNLMTILKIPDGNHLIDIFGDGHESDNHEALATWVAHLLPDLDEHEVELRINNLSKRAQTRIGSLAER